MGGIRRFGRLPELFDAETKFGEHLFLESLPGLWVRMHFAKLCIGVESPLEFAKQVILGYMEEDLLFWRRGWRLFENMPICINQLLWKGTASFELVRIHGPILGRESFGKSC